MGRLLAVVLLLGAAAADTAPKRAPHARYLRLQLGDEPARLLTWDRETLLVDGVKARFTGATEGTGKALLVYYSFDLGEVPGWSGKLTMNIWRFNKRWNPAKKSKQQRVRAWRSMEDPHLAYFYFWADGKIRRLATEVFAETPDDAPLLRTGGPLTLGSVDMEIPQAFVRGTTGLFAAAIGTAGERTFCYAMYDRVPDDVRPLAVIRFPGREPVTFKLMNKC